MAVVTRKESEGPTVIKRLGCEIIHELLGGGPVEQDVIMCHADCEPATLERSYLRYGLTNNTTIILSLYPFIIKNYM